MTNGSCTDDIVKDVLTSNCPSDFYSDLYGNCLPNPSSYPTLSPLVTCAKGYHSDGNGVCIENTYIPILTPICSRCGYKSDVNGNYCISFEPIKCDDGFISNG
jgi:hypothetical protein